MPLGGWSCDHCTYEHKAPGSRCVMCQQPRISKRDMVNFVKGQPIPSHKTVNSSTLSQPSSTTILHNPYARRPSQTSNNTSNNATTTTTSNHYAATQSSSSNNSNNKKRPRNDNHTVVSTMSNGLLLPLASSSVSVPTVAVDITASHTATNVTNNTKNNNNSKNHQTSNPFGSSFTVSLKASQQKQQKQHLTVNKTKNKSTRAPMTMTGHNKPFCNHTLPYTDGHIPYDPSTSHTWIYPLSDSYPKRQYQFEMARSALLQNTLVSLPTGLGKTLIAAVVLYNYYRWFPTGKVLFLAPTLPLVDQQVQACYKIMGISCRDTAVLTGKVPAQQRQNIWNNKRVFFCTPQTVQKDLEHGRVDPKDFVCVVLDEVHKATGEFSYCKVIQYLNQCGDNKAKFRLLGLSATPGTSIQKIQSVISTLNFNKVEARSEEDVKEYIYQRETEIVICETSSATRGIEKLLNDTILDGLLDKLRDDYGVLSHTNNATVTAYTILKAKETFLGRSDTTMSHPQQQRGPILGYLAAAHKFAQLRADLRQHGIGMVRHKLFALQAERPRGILATIVRSKAFVDLVDAVTKGTTRVNLETGTAVHDRLLNNPKLLKLQQVLVEHFERARACKKSSRAIVFSQFRDSVAEIVHVLNTQKPILQPRYFVGQSKGSGSGSSSTTITNNNNKDSGAVPQQQQQVKGMKQEEQKKVIQQFRNGLYNVLVCTCIGEEGLDIGEVDLIVNFDCLSSPIRMIQRVGRTGRKRNGRVITLLMEGTEVETYKKSQRNERTLVHALKNPNSFRVVSIIPMLPHEPVVEERCMDVSQTFHLTQLDGAANTAKRRRQSIALTEEQERRLETILGELKNLPHIVSNGVGLPRALHRRFLIGRSCSRINSASGPLTTLLRQFEQTHGGRPKVRIRKSRDKLLDSLFPLVAKDDDEDTVTQVLESVHVPSLDNNAVGTNKASSSTSTVETNNCPPNNTTESERKEQPTSAEFPNTETSRNNQPTDITEEAVGPVVPLRDAAKETFSETGLHIAKGAEPSVSSWNKAPPIVPALTASTQPPVPLLNSVASGPELRSAVAVRNETLFDDEFQLPDCDYWSDSSCDEEMERGEITSSLPERTTVAGNSLLLPVQETATTPHMDLKTHDFDLDAMEDTFRLPTPDPSSSSEEESLLGDEKPSSGDPNTIYLTRPILHHGRSSIETLDSLCDGGLASAPATSTTKAVTLPSSLLVPVQVVVHDSHGKPEEKQIYFSEARQSADHPNDDSDDDDKVLPKPSKSINKRVIQDTPDSTEKSHLSTQDPVSVNSDRGNLSNTQATPSDHTEISRRPASGREAASAIEIDLSGSEHRCDHEVRFSLDTLDPLCAGGLDSNQSGQVPRSLHLSVEQESKQPASSKGEHAGLGNDVDEEYIKPKRINSRKRVIDDTPDSARSQPSTHHSVQDSRESLGLSNTQESLSIQKVGLLSCDAIVCGICLGNSVSVENPIILCDGPRDGEECGVAVHVSCYSATIDNYDLEWRCDRCDYLRRGGTLSEIRCSKTGCSEKDGVFKLVNGCWSNMRCEPKQEKALKRIRKYQSSEFNRPESPDDPGQPENPKRRPLSRLPSNQNYEVSETRKRRRQILQRKYIDEEADADSDEEGDQEDEIRAIEDAEDDLAADFINDSSQLGYTQDDLDRAMLDEDCDAAHRELDMKRQKQLEFATPMLNRRLQDRTPSTGPESQRGLGNMHFIRSVLEHHRNGGEAEEIEQAYLEMERDANSDKDDSAWD